MPDIKLPRIYLIKRDAVQSESVQHALRIAPADVALVPSAEDQKALEESPLEISITSLLNAPIAIIADGFEHDLVVLNDDSSLEILCPAQSKSKTS